MGGSAKTIGRAGLGAITMGGSELLQRNPYGIPLKNPLSPNTPFFQGDTLFGHNNNGISGDGSSSSPFFMDPAQIAADQKSITDLGDKNFAETNAFNTADQANRSSARQALADALTKQSQASFQQGVPATEETLNAQHLLNGSGLGQELARQQGNIATNIVNQVGTQGIGDINRSSDLGFGALQAKQGAGQSALSRGFSLNDFINQANVAKSIGAQAAPQVGNGKGQTGTLLSGVGSLAPLAGVVMGGPAGAGIGKAASKAVNPNPGLV